ncbi:MAG: PKD domain-containing protein [Planctomycetota bacterium]
MPTARHIYSAEGTYTVRLRITDETGFVDETTREVVVEGEETVTLTIVIAGAGSGSVSLDPLGEICETTYSYEVKPGLRIYVLPLADAGSEFTGMAGCDQPGDFDLGLEGCGALVNEDRTLTVTFEPE